MIRIHRMNMTRTLPSTSSRLRYPWRATGQSGLFLDASRPDPISLCLVTRLRNGIAGHLPAPGIVKREVGSACLVHIVARFLLPFNAPLSLSHGFENTDEGVCARTISEGDGG